MRLHHLGFLSATLILSLISPLQIAIIPLQMEAVQAQTTEQCKQQALQLNKLGLQQFRKGEFREALKRFEQVLVIVREIGDRQGEGAVLNNIGLVYDHLGQYPKALENYKNALTIAKQIGDLAGQGTTLNNIGGVYYNLGQYPKALENDKDALTIKRPKRACYLCSPSITVSCSFSCTA